MLFPNPSSRVIPPSPDWSTGVFLGRPIPPRIRQPGWIPPPVIKKWDHFLHRRRRVQYRTVVKLPPPDAGVEHPRAVPPKCWATAAVAHLNGRTVAGIFREDPIDWGVGGWTSTGVMCWFRGRHPQWTPRRVGSVLVHPMGISKWVKDVHSSRSTYLRIKSRRRRPWTALVRSRRRRSGGYHRIQGWGFTLGTAWIPRETWVPDPSRDFEITRIYTRRWRMGVSFPDREKMYLKVPGGRRGVRPRRWRSVPTVPWGGPVPRGWYPYLRPTRRYLRWRRQRAKWRPTRLPKGPARLVWASRGVPPLLAPRVWTRISRGYTPVRNPGRRRPRWWWRAAARVSHPGWDTRAARATWGIPRWWARHARRVPPRRWPHRWNTTVAYALAGGLGLTRKGALFPTRWVPLGMGGRLTRRVTQGVPPRGVEPPPGKPELQGEGESLWVAPAGWFRHSGRVNRRSRPRRAAPLWGAAPTRWIRYKTRINRRRLRGLVNTAAAVLTNFDYQRVGGRQWVGHPGRGGPDFRPYVGGYANQVELRRCMFRHLTASIYKLPARPWGTTRWGGHRESIEETVWNYQVERPVVRPARPIPPPAPGSWEWWRRLAYSDVPRRPGAPQRRRPWIPWEIYRKVMNPPPRWKVYAAAALWRWSNLRWAPTANPRRPRRFWLPKPHFKWRRKIRPRRRYLVLRQEYPLGRRRQANAVYNRVHGFTVRFRRMPKAFSRRRIRMRRLYGGYYRPRWRHHWPATTVKQFLLRRGRPPRRRRRPRRGRRRIRLTPPEQGGLTRLRAGQYHRIRSVPTLQGWSTRLWGLFVRGGRKTWVENLSRRLRGDGFHPWELYAGGWSHLGTRAHRRGGATLKVPTTVIPSKAAALFRRWIARTVRTRSDRKWAHRVESVLTDPSGVVKLRDAYNRDALINVAFL